MSIAKSADTLTLAPFTAEQLQDDLCTILMLEMRRVVQLIDWSVQWSPLGLGGNTGPKEGWWDSENTAKEAGLTFDKISHTTFAKAILDHYDYGFLGLTGTRSEEMHWDSVHTFIAAYLLDLAKSVYLEEWHGEGAPDLKEAVQRCLHTIKISNARRLLEGHEPFCHKFGNSPDDSDTRGELSIAQVAMLAGMEEMSLRSAISRKTAPVLKIEKDERRTYIDAEVAKEWLKAKKRYISVRKGRRHQDFSTTAFRSVGEFVAALEDRAAVAGDEDPSAAAQLTAALAVKGKAALSDLVDTDVADEPLLTAVAQALKLPADLVRYRANEALLQSDIEWRQHQLRALRAGKPDTAS